MIDYTLPLDQLPDPLPIEPLTKPFDVTITPPGSKSITCRAYVLAALAEGESKIIRPLRADDTDRLLDALCTLGAEARWAPGGEDVFIKGVGGRFPRGGSVNLGDGGTPARFMIAVACLAAEPVVVDGSKRMRERPIAEGVEMLRQLRATIEYVEEEGRLPVRVVPSQDLAGGRLELTRTASSQFISAIMLISPWLRGNIDINYGEPPTSPSYVELTCDVLAGFDVGAIATEEDCDDLDRILFERHIISSKPLLAQEFRVEPDASSAVVFAAAAGLIANSRVFLPGLTVGTVQADAEIILDAFEFDAGEASDDDMCLRSDHGTLDVADGELNLERAPDGALSYAAASAQRRKAIRLTGLHTLRVKETDRLAALEAELTKIGCIVSTADDSITIDPSTRHDDPVVIETYNDHRMAMAFGVLGLARPGLSIRNPACVAKSYPRFWADFAKLYH